MKKYLLLLSLVCSQMFSQIVEYPGTRIFKGILRVTDAATFDFKGTEIDSIVVSGDSLYFYVGGDIYKSLQEEYDPVYLESVASEISVLDTNNYRAYIDDSSNVIKFADTNNVIATKSDVMLATSGTPVAGQIATFTSATEIGGTDSLKRENDSLKHIGTFYNNGYLYATRLYSPYVEVQATTTTGVSSSVTTGTGLYGYATGIGGYGVYARTGQGSALFVERAGNNSSSASLIDITDLTGGSANRTGNIITITDNPATSGTKSGKVLSVTVGSTERISMNPRATNYNYIWDNNSAITGGSYHTQWKNEGSVIGSISGTGIFNAYGIRGLNETEGVFFDNGSVIRFAAGAYTIGKFSQSDTSFYLGVANDTLFRTNLSETKIFNNITLNGNNTLGNDASDVTTINGQLIITGDTIDPHIFVDLYDKSIATALTEDDTIQLTQANDSLFYEGQQSHFYQWQFLTGDTLVAQYDQHFTGAISLSVRSTGGGGEYKLIVKKNGIIQSVVGEETTAASQLKSLHKQFGFEVEIGDKIWFDIVNISSSNDFNIENLSIIFDLIHLM